MSQLAWSKLGYDEWLGQIAADRSFCKLNRNHSVLYGWINIWRDNINFANASTVLTATKNTIQSALNGIADTSNMHIYIQWEAIERISILHKYLILVGIIWMGSINGGMKRTRLMFIWCSPSGKDCVKRRQLVDGIKCGKNCKNANSGSKTFVRCGLCEWVSEANGSCMKGSIRKPKAGSSIETYTKRLIAG